MHIHIIVHHVRRKPQATFRNDGPSMITHGEDDIKHGRIEDDTTTGDFRTLKPP